MPSTPIPETGARVVDTDKCIGCGLCHEACPWNMPQIDPVIGKSTKCIACGRCAVQCPNGAIKFVDWQDIAQEAIDKASFVRRPCSPRLNLATNLTCLRKDASWIA